MGTLLRTPDGKDVLDVPPEQVEAKIAAGYSPVSAQARAADIAQQAKDARAAERGTLGKVAAGVTAFGAGVSLGGTDLALRKLLSKDEWDQLVLERNANPGLSTAANIVGSVAPVLLTGGAAAPATTVGRVAAATPTARAAALGTRAAEGATAALGTGTAAKVGGAIVGGAAEGALYGIGTGVSELALSEDPLTVERMGSTLTSHALFGAATGGVAGGVGKGVELGLAKARTAITEGMAARRAVDGLPEDLAGLDAKGLRAARDVELEAIEAARVPARKQIADDLATFRSETKASKPFLATHGLDDAELKVIGKQAFNADKQLDRILDNPKYLASKPEQAIAALQKQEHAYEQLLAKREQVAAAAVARGETGATRAAAVDAAEAALERNRALQMRIGEVTGKPTSARLVAIDDAKDALTTAASRERSVGEQILGGVTFGKVAAGIGAIGAAVGGPVEGAAALMAPVIGARASKLVTERVFGGMAKGSAAAQKRVADGVAAFLDTTGKVVKAAPVVATKVLTSLRYAPDEKRPAYTAPEQKKVAGPAPSSTSRDLTEAYTARAAEIRSQMGTAPDGKPVMRPDARAKIADQLAPIAAMAPLLADRLETIAARRLEFLASKLPRRPDVAGMALGPDLWRPSEMEMRTFARYAAAVEDPHAIVERLADGTVTPEDAEAMRGVYPELHADITRQIVEKLPTLRKQLPYQRRIALSLFSGVAVDPAMDPRILDQLQALHVAEEGSNQGTTAPTAQPQFGSVRSADKATPAQRRQMEGA